MAPVASRSKLPAEYRVEEESGRLLPWSHAVERLNTAQHYWLATVTPEGTPHCRPVAGMWVDDRLYFGGGTDVKWLRNLLSNSSASITLEDAEEVVILEGRVELIRPCGSLSARIVEVSNRKYEQGQKQGDYEGKPLCEFVPHKALAWTVLSEDATRFRF